MNDVENAAGPGYTQHRRFWRLIVVAMVLGAVGAVSGLVFLGLTDLGPKLYGEQASGWMEGKVWWVAVTTGAGLVVGVLRHRLGLQGETPGLVKNLREEEVDAKGVAKVVAVSAVSLFGGASLGPEVALGHIGGGTGSVLADRADLDDDARKEYTLTGIAGAFGGLFSSPLMSSILVMEISSPPRRRVGVSLMGTLVSSTVSLGLYFAVAGTVFLGLYDVPAYDYEDWHLVAGLGLGLCAALVVVATMVMTMATRRLFERVSVPPVALAMLGGLVFGLVGVMLPLTNFTGTSQLATALQSAGTLSVGLLLATMIAKMLTLAVSQSTGFVGGAIFPMLFLGGVGGIVIHLLIPGIPLGLAFASMLAAVPGALIAAPFTLVLLAALLTGVGALQTSPIVVAVATSFLTISALKLAMARRKAATKTG
ncbi:MAG TPA: chloride channel protein [Nitriliruptoraceae bacterium]|nr:chloride channel protein [Nitriliruptoraceae bacterium]